MPFQFTISPGVSKPVSKTIEEKQDERICVLLAPFTPSAKMCFENVIVGTVKTQKLFLENPAQTDIEVFIKNLPLPEKQVKLGWESRVISAETTAVLEIMWSPITEDSWRHNFIFEVTRFLKKDVAISFKAVSAQKSKPTKFLRRKVVSKKMKTPPKTVISKCSTNTSNGNPFCWTQLASPNIKPQMKSATSLSKIERRWNKENLHPVWQSESLSETNCIVSDHFLNPNNTTYNIETTNLDVKRSTYTKSTLSLHVRNYLKKETFNDSLEESPILEELIENQQLNNKTEFLDINQLLSFSPAKSTTSDFVPNLCSSFCKSELDTNVIFAETLNGNSIDLYNISSETYIKDNSCSERHTIRDQLRSDNSNSQKRKATAALFLVSPPKKLLLDYSVEHKSHYVPSSKRKNNKHPSITRNLVEYIDPFITGSISHNMQKMEEQQVCFQKWLNALLTPPAELDSDIDVHPVDVAKLWQQCKTKTVPAAPSKEVISNEYHTNKKLDVLRKSATDLFKSQELREVFRKVQLLVESGKLSIRKDREVHLDLSLQANIMTLFLSYNPLWLRIGIETIYGVTIQLVSNSDIMGLSSFIMHRFFKDQNLIKKHKTVHAPKYIIDIKKFILKKFLMLVYFLDVAKTKTLITHDPCLFCKNAPIKESREILLTFSKEVLSAVGDVTKFLRLSGYTVCHKQKYIHEFDYSVLHLGIDLRDGVRLTKVMEIILMETGLTDNLRVPAISKLQKIHNMKIVFNALQNASFEIVGGIQPKDIVDGHHEKTLSFLWQIIYKFQAPRFIKAATVIQMWWRSLNIVIKCKVMLRKRSKACVIIQRWYRHQRLARKLQSFAENMQKYSKYRRLEINACKIQSYYRMIIQKRKYNKLKQSAIAIQKHTRGYLIRRNYQNMLCALVKIQAFIRMCICRNYYCKLQASVINMQQIYKSKQLMLVQREQYSQLRKTVIKIQRRFRANNSMQMERLRFRELKKATVIIQRRFRANQEMKLAKAREKVLIKSIILVQSRFRANAKMKIERKEFVELKKAVVTVQIRFKANNLCKTERIKYKRMREAVIIIQNWYRKNTLMQIDRSRFLNMKRAVKIIEQRYKAWKAKKNEIVKFEKLKWAAIVIQRRWRAVKLMEKERLKYLNLRNSTVVIQRTFRRLKNTIEARREFLKALNKRKTAAVKIQTLWRGYYTRKQFPEIRVIRMAIEEITSMAISHDTLGNRRERALHKLVHPSATLSQIIYALEDLDFITRRCKNTCVQMSRLISENMYMTIVSTNRSAAEMHVCSIAASILINFWKYEPARLSSIHLKYMDNIISVMSHCCDKEEKLFPYLCTLLWMMGHDGDCKAAILSIPKCSQKLLKIRSLCLRKQKMVLLQQHKVSSYFITDFDLPVPSLLPDWGLDYLDKPRVFTNSVHGFNCVLNILDLN